MAINTNPVFPSKPYTAIWDFGATNGVEVTLYQNDFSQCTRLTSILASNNDSSDYDLTLFFVINSVESLVNTVTVPAGAGADKTIPAVELIPDSLRDKDGYCYIEGGISVRVRADSEPGDDNLLVCCLSAAEYSAQAAAPKFVDRPIMETSHINSAEAAGEYGYAIPFGGLYGDFDAIPFGGKIEKILISSGDSAVRTLQVCLNETVIQSFSIPAGSGITPGKPMVDVTPSAIKNKDGYIELPGDGSTLLNLKIDAEPAGGDVLQYVVIGGAY